MLALAGDAFGPELKSVALASAASARVMVEGTNRADVVRGARVVREAFAEGPPEPAGNAPSADLLSQMRGRTDGLLSQEIRSLIMANDTAAVREASEARLFGLAPPLFSVKDDPMLLATSYVESLAGFLAPGWMFQDGMPMKAEGGTVSALVALTLKGRAPRDVAAAMECLPRELPSGVKARFSGAAFHTALSACSAQREIGVLSFVSLALILVLGWRLFRSFGFVAPLAAALAAGGLAASGALFAAWPRPHVLTFVFGTSLLGLSVDYVYHARAAGGARNVLKPLTQSFATTLACFAPLLLADLPVLRQMALFTMAGLAAVYAFVVVFSGDGGGARERAPGGRATALSALLPRVLLFAAAAGGVFFLRPSTDPTAFYRPSAALAADERAVAERLSLGGARLVFVRGDSLQEALEREEAAGVPFGLSRIVPSLRRQRENAALAARLYAAEGAAYAEDTGLKRPVAPAEPRLLDPDCFAPGSPLAAVVGAMWTGRGLMSPCAEGFEPSGPHVAVIDMRRSMEGVFARAMDSTLRLFFASAAALVVFLALVFRRRMFEFAGPVAAALVATAGTLGWLGVPFTFFTLLSFFVLMGLGLDYAIFHRSAAAPSARRTVFYAFLTSLAGLGLLSFTAFPVTRDMGVTFAFGLFFAYVFSLPSAASGRGRDGARPSQNGAWFAQGEQSAGRWRMEFMWLAYAWLGKGFLKALCVPVMAFIYPFARPAKAALRRYYHVLAAFRPDAPHVPRPSAWTLFRHLLGFAWSLADKTDACSLKKGLPRMAVRDDAGFRAFRDCLAAGNGAFVMTSHVGTAEVLPALPLVCRGLPSAPHVHAFQQMAHDAVFTEVFMRRFDASSLTLHAVEAIGVETAVEMKAAIARGELVMMAGDRVSAGSAKTLKERFLGVDCAWPKGVFAFARLMEAPVFFVTCVRVGWNAYEAHFAAAPAADGRRGMAGMLAAYAGFLEGEVLAHPLEWHQFYDFFAWPQSTAGQ